MSLLFASTNLGKLKEVRSILSPLEISTPFDLSLAELEVNETGQTFAENALLKARAFAELSHLTTFADDSGLEVVALKGFPGINSARWFAGSDHDRNQELLKLLKDETNRSAQFRTVLCLYDPQTKESKYFEGIIKGQIASHEQGEEGFGYDPLFIPEGYSQPFAVLGQQIKNQLSHRSQALQKFKEYLLSCHTNPLPLS